MKNAIIGKTFHEQLIETRCQLVASELGLDDRSPGKLNIDGKISSEPADISDHFNQFYSNIAEKIVEKLLNAPNKFGDNGTENYYQAKKTSKKLVLNL